jgi:hypothetical protein
MASFTQVTKAKRAARARNMGRARKSKMAERSTVSYDELFAALGDPGQPAPKAAPKKASGSSATS